MSVQLIVYEDDKSERFLPLTWTRPVFDLRCGISSIREKIQCAYPDVSVSLACRDSVKKSIKEFDPVVKINTVSSDEVLFINGRVLAVPDLCLRIPLKGEEKVYIAGDDVVAARVKGKRLKDLGSKLGRLLKREDFDLSREERVEACLAGYVWDLVNHNHDQIIQDFDTIGYKRSQAGRVYKGAHLLNPDMIFVAQTAVVKPCAVLDAESGPIIIDEETEIMSGAVIKGPAYIGRSSSIRIGAKIYGGTTIGAVCNIGGEVEESIIHSHTNKQHEGFLGHSYLGQWVNLGANTTNSDLKNNYSSVRVYINGKWVDSEQVFVGLVIGDHSKSGIGTLFNTGTMVGVCCNVFGSGFQPKFIPSFSWGGADGFKEYDLDRCIDTAREVMARREMTMGKAYTEMLRDIFQKTAEERKQSW